MRRRLLSWCFLPLTVAVAGLAQSGAPHEAKVYAVRELSSPPVPPTWERRECLAGRVARQRRREISKRFRLHRRPAPRQRAAASAQHRKGAESAPGAATIVAPRSLRHQCCQWLTSDS
eukprot:scaffold203470_cov30-Tisochrysis_lutea.AAC.4